MLVDYIVVHCIYFLDLSIHLDPLLFWRRNYFFLNFSTLVYKM